MKKYKILMITTGFAPYEFSEAIVNSKLVLALINAGHQVDVISRESQQVYATGWSPIWEPLKNNTYFIEEDRSNRKLKRLIEILIALLFFKYPISGIRWGYKVYKLALKKNEFKHYDVLLTRMPSNIPHLIGKKLQNKLKIAWIANWNDPTDNIRPLLEDRNIVKSRIDNLLVRDIFKKATVNTYPSYELWQYFNEKIIHDYEKNVEIIPHIGININNKNQNIIAPKDEFSMCHAGNMWSNIDPEPLFMALRNLKKCNRKFKLHVYGTINSKFTGMINQYELNDCIVCHESICYEKMLSELQKYDLLILLEAQYEKGILMLSKFSDYASVRKPILCISPLKGVIPNYIKEYGGGFSVDNKNAESIFNGLNLMINDLTNNQTESEIRTTQNLFNQFSPEKIVKQYEDIFNRII